MKLKSFQKLAADELLFSDYLLENERKIIERGWDSFKWGFYHFMATSRRRFTAYCHNVFRLPA